MSNVFPQKGEYTYDDLIQLENSEKYELIDGSLYMRGEPSNRHQEVLRELSAELTFFLRGKKCILYFHPFLVRLNKKTSFHPDLAVICDKNKIDDQHGGCNGAPDLVIEILSPSNAGYDIFRKYNQYLKAGVKECWIVNPINNTVTVHIVDNGNYKPTFYTEQDIIPVTVLPECKIDLKIIFRKDEQ